MVIETHQIGAHFSSDHEGNSYSASHDKEVLSTAAWQELRDNTERCFVIHQGGGLLNRLVNLSLKGCAQLHRTDVVLKKSQGMLTQGLRVSPHGPLPLPGGLPRRSFSYAGSSNGKSPSHLVPVHESPSSSLGAPDSPPLSPALAAAHKPAAPVKQAQGTKHVLPPSAGGSGCPSSRLSLHVRCSAVEGVGGSCSPSPSNSPDHRGLHLHSTIEDCMAQSSRGLVSQQHGVGDSARLLADESPCDLRSWSAPSRSCSDHPVARQGLESGRRSLDTGSPPSMGAERLAFGVSTAIGVRSTMEDFAFALPLAQPIGAEPCEFLRAACFGVFDGHGGAGVAQSLAEHVPGRIQEDLHQIIEFGPQQIADVLTGHENFLRRLSEAWIVESSQSLTADTSLRAPNLISPCPTWEGHAESTVRKLQAQVLGGGQQQRGFQEMPCRQQQQQIQGLDSQQQQQQQQEFRGMDNLEAGDPGSTALVVTIVGDRLFCANVGDCRLLVAELDPKTNTVLPRRVTCDHNYQHPGEAARLAALSVSVSADGYVGGQEGWLQVSRSIGDFSAKRALGEEIILSEPELHTLRLTDNMLFAVAVSDGITNKLTDETIVNQVCRFLSEVPPARKDPVAADLHPKGGASPPVVARNNDPHYAAAQLVQYAINAADSDDNCSVVVVSFKDSPPPVPRRPRLFQRKTLTSSSLAL